LQLSFDFEDEYEDDEHDLNTLLRRQ
jgi:hypothetical protein